MIRIVKALLLSLALTLPAFASGPVDINNADAAALAAALNGVGQAKAEAIVAYRDQHGPFRSADELALVRGIGLATVERNRDMILVEGEESEPEQVASRGSDQ